MKDVKTHEFVVHGGRESDPERPGKVEWPDHMHITFSRFHAKKMAHRLLNFLLDSEDEEYIYSTMGELHHDVPENT